MKLNKPITGLRVFFMMICFSVILPLKSQTNSDGTAPQFLFSEFSDGVIKMKNGKNQTISLNYNVVSEKMVYEKDGQMYDLANTEMVDTIFLQECRFIPVGKIFHEVLLIAPITLFIQHKGDLIPPGKPAGYGGTSQVSSTKIVSSVQLSSGYYNLKIPDDYEVKKDMVYWIRKDSEFFSFMNERQFVKLFPGKESDLKKFTKENRIKFEKKENVFKLVQYCNELMQK